MSLGRALRWPLGLGLALVTLGAFGVRALALDQQSAYMDETTYILTGRLLIEEGSVYARTLDWAYGSYLWSLIAGAADMAGGLWLVRLVAAGLGALMVLATALLTRALVPATWSAGQRSAAALAGGLLMAVMPTAIALGRFGTYDAPSGAAFMLGIALLVPSEARGRRLGLLFAAFLLFVAFLAKYLAALYFPFICLALMFASGSLRRGLRNVVWFVIPLSLACAAYFVIFYAELMTLLQSSVGYTDLRSPNALREYVWERFDLWVLLALAAIGWRFATRTGRLVAVGGAGVMLGFQLIARPDFDLWKHAIYVIFFLAPLAAFALVALVRDALEGDPSQRRPDGSAPRWQAFMLAGTALVCVWAVAGPILAEAERLVSFYPNLNPSLDAIRRHTAGAATVLTDDTALRYYLYPRIPTERVTGPFFVEYRGEHDSEAYRRAIAARYYDAIVLDGGVSPAGHAVRRDHGSLIAQHYERVYARPDRDLAVVEVYLPRRDDLQPRATAAPASAATFVFGQGVQGWGARAERAELEPGLNVEIDRERTWEGEPTLRFTTSEQSSTVGVRIEAPVAMMRAWVYMVADPGVRALPVGMYAFDDAWQWYDDGFRSFVPVGSWSEVWWQPPERLTFKEIGFMFPQGVRAAYFGQVELLHPPDAASSPAR